MHSLSEYILEKLIINNDSQLEEDCFLIEIVKGFIKEECNKELKSVINNWVKNNKVKECEFITYKGNFARNKLSEDLILKFNVKKCDDYKSWESLFPLTWVSDDHDPGEDPNYWTKKTNKVTICGNKEHMLIYVDEEVQLLIKKINK